MGITRGVKRTSGQYFSNTRMFQTVPWNVIVDMHDRLVPASQLWFKDVFLREKEKTIELIVQVWANESEDAVWKGRKDRDIYEMVTHLNYDWTNCYLTLISLLVAINFNYCGNRNNFNFLGRFMRNSRVKYKRKANPEVIRFGIYLWLQNQKENQNHPIARFN